MCQRDAESQHVIALQSDMFRLAARDYALTFKRLSLLSGVPTTTLESWAKGVAMPLYGFIKIAPHVPDELLSMVVEPAGKFVGSVEPVAGDVHDLASDAADLSGLAVRAMHPESPGGVHIVPSERGAIRDVARRLGPKALRMAAA